MKRFLSILLLSILVVMASANRKPTVVHVIGNEVKPFSLINCNGKDFSLVDYRDANGFILVFTCNHCPFAKLYTQRLNEMNAKYKALGVPLIAINPMDSNIYEEETFAGMQSWATEKKFNFPYLQDASQDVARMFHATHTPDAFVIWKEQGKYIIRYSGAIDDNGEKPAEAHSFIGAAVDQLLSGKSVTKPETFSFGCAISYR